MTKVKSLADLKAMREKLKANLDIREKAENIEAVFTQTGCMGYCNAEPTIEVRMPGKDPVVFGGVDNNRAEEILTKYVQKGEQVEGVIPVSY